MEIIEYYKNLDLTDIVYTNEFGMKCTEIWKDIPDYEGYYQASNLGRLKGLDRILRFDAARTKNWKGKILKGYVCKKKGYVKCCLLKEGVYHHSLVHIVVAKTWIPNPLNLPQVNHTGLYSDGKEGNKLDNRVISLKWGNASTNGKDSFANGYSTPRSGIKSNFSKLNENQVLEIRSNILNLKNIELAKKYNVSTGLISMIINNKIWTYLN